MPACSLFPRDCQCTEHYSTSRIAEVCMDPVYTTRPGLKYQLLYTVPSSWRNTCHQVDIWMSMDIKDIAAAYLHLTAEGALH